MRYARFPPFLFPSLVHATGLRLLLACLLLLAAARALGEPLIRIDSAMLRLEDGNTLRVPLPDSWNRHQRSGTVEYRVAFQAGKTLEGPWALYVPRVGNRAVVYLNGRVVGQLGRLDGDLSDHAQRPHLFFVPAEDLRQGPNELRFVVQGEKARYAGLSDVVIGPVSSVRPLFIWREVVQLWGSFAIILTSMLFGMISGALALTVKDRSFAIFCGACLFCAVRTSYAVVTDPPMDYRLWAAVTDGCYAGYLACLCLFCVNTLHLHKRWITGATTALIGFTVLLLPAYGWWRFVQARQVLLAIMVVYALALCVAVIIQWYRVRTSESRYLAAAGVISFGLAVHDHIVVFYTESGYTSFAIARYSLLIFVIAMGALLVDRYVRQEQREVRLRREVELELQQKKATLEAHFDAQQSLAAANAHQVERQHLLQDLHDGMGIQLSGLLSMVQNGPLERIELTREVRTTIEQMRMLLDSTEGFDGDVSILFGQIRYRVEQRLRRQGIKLTWDVSLNQPGRELKPENAIALQRLVFELVTNTLKHSGASTALFQARDEVGLQAELCIVYCDDGRGFSPDGIVAGIGTASIPRRASNLGARIELKTAKLHGVRYEISIPAKAFASPTGADKNDAPESLASSMLDLKSR